MVERACLYLRARIIPLQRNLKRGRIRLPNHLPRGSNELWYFKRPRLEWYKTQLNIGLHRKEPSRKPITRKLYCLYWKINLTKKVALLGRPFTFNRIFYDKPSDKKSYYNKLVSYTKEGQDSSLKCTLSSRQENN